MPAQTQKLTYDPEQELQELLTVVTDVYQRNISKGISLRQSARELDITPLKLRKLLITAGAFSSDICDRINTLYNEGKTIAQIQELTSLSHASVSSYLPYSKTVYKTHEISRNAQRIRLYRERQAAADRLQTAINEHADLDTLQDLLWNALIKFSGYTFNTINGLEFSYTIKGYEMFVNRKEKSITRSSVNIAFQQASVLHGVVTGPKKLKTFGASYLYAIFQRLGVISQTH